MKLKPLHDYVLIRRGEEETQSPGGIIIPETSAAKSDRGKVLAVGPGAWSDKGNFRLPMQVKKNDVVLLPKFGGTDVDGRGPREVLLRESELLGVVENSNR